MAAGNKVTLRPSLEGTTHLTNQKRSVCGGGRLQVSQRICKR